MSRVASPALAALLLTPLAALATDSQLSVESSRKSTDSVVNGRQHRLHVHAFAPLRFEPCVSELAPLGGVNTSS